jgi:hypothetical protein
MNGFEIGWRDAQSTKRGPERVTGHEGKSGSRLPPAVASRWTGRKSKAGKAPRRLHHNLISCPSGPSGPSPALGLYGVTDYRHDRYANTAGKVNCHGSTKSRSWVSRSNKWGRDTRKQNYWLRPHKKLKVSAAGASVLRRPRMFQKSLIRSSSEKQIWSQAWQRQKWEMSKISMKLTFGSSSDPHHDHHNNGPVLQVRNFGEHQLNRKLRESVKS